MNDELNRRNTESVFAKLRELDLMVREQKITLDNLLRLVAEQAKRIGILEDAELNRRIKAMGSGPTEK